MFQLSFLERGLQLIIVLEQKQTRIISPQLIEISFYNQVLLWISGTWSNLAKSSKKINSKDGPRIFSVSPPSFIVSG